MRTGVIGGRLGYRLLRAINPTGEDPLTGAAYDDRSKLEVMLGPGIWEDVRDRVVIDFGCGHGTDAIELARRGARRVVGIDIQESVLETARGAAARAGLAQRCVFTSVAAETADVILSVDGFEHYDDPHGVLTLMRRLVAPGGRVRIAFGPPWLHPYGGHFFSVFPWAHLVFSEAALIRWRADFKSDGATRFGEVAGGLNQMTIARFRDLVDRSDFEAERYQCVPIRRLRWLTSGLTREFTTSIVRCILRPRSPAALMNGVDAVQHPASHR